MNLRWLTRYSQALTVFDAVSTGLLLHQDHAIEANPLVNWLVTNFGVVPAMTLRATVGLVMIELLYLITEEHNEFEWVVNTIAVIMSVVTAWHVYGWVVWT